MKKKSALLLFILPLIFLTACQDITMWFKDFQQSFTGLTMTVSTYDEGSQLIDRISGKSVLIERDATFDSSETTADSQVIRLTIGGQEMHHVGSSMIVAEKGLENVFDAYKQSNDLTNQDLSIPIVNRVVNEFKNSFTGKKKVVVIRSQNGTPLATYAGDKVSIYSTDVPKSTGILIDGKYLFIYRCDYTIYDTGLLMGNEG